MPITPNNMYVSDEQLRHRMWEEAREYVKRSLQALSSTGYRRITFEIFPFDYAGDDWVRMTKETHENVEQILAEIN